MKFLILTVVYAVVASAQLLPRGLSKVGEDVGGRVGSSIGSGIGHVLDGEIPDLMSLPVGKHGKSARPYQPSSGHGQDGYGSGGRYGSRDYERGSSSSGGRGYQTKSYEGEYESGGSYSRERTVKEREHGTGYNAGRDGQRSSKGESGGRYESYGRDRTSYGDEYKQGYNRK